MTTTEPLILIVSLWLKADDVAGFEAFERDAAAVMARHGGRIERVIRLDRSASAEAPFEVHVVRFPSPSAFEAYRADPATQALAPRREAVVARTAILRGHALPPYG